MAIHIWCPRVSDTAVRLRDAIRAAGINCYKSPVTTRRHDRMQRFLERVSAGDLFVTWGARYAGVFSVARETVRILNDVTTLNKRSQLIELARNGIPVPEVFDAPGDGRIGRSLNHVGGGDLLRGDGRDYWTQKLDVRTEIRVHVFRGKCIRAGVKIPREGFCMFAYCRMCTGPKGTWNGERGADDEVFVHGPHPWVRSFDAGWRISYGAQHDIIRNTHRDLAKRAVTALGLDFGAVDIGLVQTPRGVTAAVLEVNLAPGLDDGPIEAYVRHILAAYGRNQ